MLVMPETSQLAGDTGGCGGTAGGGASASGGGGAYGAAQITVIDDVDTAS